MPGAASPAADRAAVAREAGVAFLLARQGPDGAWRDFATLAGEAVDWPTAWVAEHLRAAGADPAALDRAAAWLEGSRRPGGGWGYHAGVPEDADSTAWAVLFLARWRGPAAVAEPAARLAAARDPATGGFPTYADPAALRRYLGLDPAVALDGWCAPHPSVTATAGRALLAAGGETSKGAAAGGWADVARAAWRHLAQAQEPSGAWRSYWWTEPFYPTAEAVALAAALSEGAEARALAAAWLAARAAGDWGWTVAPGRPATVLGAASALRALALLGAPRAALDAGCAFLARMQQRDGGWPAEPVLRIPRPDDRAPDPGGPWRAGGLGAGSAVADHRRAFTTAACVAALTAAGAAPCSG